MATEKYIGKTYRLRSGSPMPVKGGKFVLQTFMAEVSDVEIITCTNDLPSSSKFRGQGGNLVSANFARLGTKDGNTFSGKIVYSPKYIDEDDIK